MAIDLALLRTIKYKEQFVKVHRYIPSSAIDKRTKAIVADIEKYFELHDADDVLDFEVFRSLFFTKWHKKLEKADCDYYNRVIARMEDDCSEQQVKGIINSLLELDFATTLGNMVEEYDQGEEIDLIPAVSNLAQAVRDSMERATAFEYADFDHNDMLEEEATEGYSWPLECLDEVYYPIDGGKQTIVAARPGLGKTTFLCQLNAHIAAQMPENKIIVWFNNESRRQAIMSRQIQSALGVTKDVIKVMNDNGTLKQEYVAAVGRPDRIRVFDIHGKNNFHLEDILESIGLENVGAIVIDMLDNVKFPSSKKESREDQRLEAMYQWSRELGVKYNCHVFPTSQVSNEGAGLLFPLEHMLKESKTGKQGACDNILMIGKEDDPLRDDFRGISMPKDKCKKTGKQTVRAEVVFSADTGRYKG